MPLEAGFATCDITPPIGCPLSGWAGRDQLASSIDDPLEAVALFIAGDGGAFAIVCADLEDVDAAFVADVRAQAAAQAGLEPHRIMVCATHDHFAPCLRPVPYTKRLLREAVDDNYTRETARRLADTVVEAARARRPAVAACSCARAPGISFNRRPVDVYQNVQWRGVLEPQAAEVASRVGAELAAAWPRHGHLGPRLSPPLVELDGLRAAPVDNEVPILRIDTTEGTPLATLGTFAAHGVAGKGDLYAISADYPAEARHSFQRATGGPMILANGCCGDVGPAWRGGDSRARVGGAIGCAAAAAWHRALPLEADPPVGALSCMVQIPVPPGFPTIAEATAELEQYGHLDDDVGIRARRRYKRALEVGDRPATPREVWAARVGDMGIVGLPGEILAEIGLQIKQRSPFAITSVISMANDSAQYMCTDAAIREGGMEPGPQQPAQRTNCNGPGTEAALVESALQMLRQLHAG